MQKDCLLMLCLYMCSFAYLRARKGKDIGKKNEEIGKGDGFMKKFFY